MTDLNALSALLADATRAGVHRCAPERLDELCAAARSRAMAVIEVDGTAMHDKATLLAELARAFALPDWFGQNWDALADCLTDLSWKEADGFVVLWRNAAPVARQLPDALAAALDVMRDAADCWRNDGLPFWVLLDADCGACAHCPSLPQA